VVCIPIKCVEQAACGVGGEEANELGLVVIFEKAIEERIRACSRDSARAEDGGGLKDAAVLEGVVDFVLHRSFERMSQSE
jgi:hypothetical protein